MVDSCSKIFVAAYLRVRRSCDSGRTAPDSRAARGGAMFFNRFRSAVPAQPVVDPTPSPAAFLLCPLTGLPFTAPAPCQWQQDLYAWALAQAQAVARPSLLERDLLGVWN
jgi:hypothetical protein